MLDNFIAPYDATVVARLKAAGAVMLGKANMDEFAMGSSNETSYYGPVKNPWDTTKVPGGSSGGSAAATAARLAPFTTGTDTGGSIRQPAALTGVTGVKPTYGRVSRYGMIAFASSLDQAGVLRPQRGGCGGRAAGHGRVRSARTRPASMRRSRTIPPLLDAPLKGLKIGLLREFFDGSGGPQRGAHSGRAEDLHAASGAETVEVSLPHLPLSVPTYYVVAPAECSSNLSRFDGVRFGYRCEQPKDLHGSVQALARRGLRRRSEAPHHDRHLRVVGRLFRCLLFEGAEGAPPDHRRFSRGVREGRPADRTDHADAGLRHRREDR